MKKRILLSRTDNIGDVILSLPMAGWIKQHLPNSEILFLGKSYTKSIVSCCSFIDAFYNWDDISHSNDPVAAFQQMNADVIVHVFPQKKIAQYAKSAGIAQRIGTSHRLFHWIYCNRLVSVGRKNSPLHEAQLNLKLLKPMSLPTDVPCELIPNYYGFSRIPKLDPIKYETWIHPGKCNVILHPKSKGSAKEWDPAHFVELTNRLPKDQFHFIVCGVAEEKPFVEKHILSHAPHIQNAMGQLTLQEYIALISNCQALVAASTGPLHIAAALGIGAIGLYPPERPINPKRWGPLGKKAVYFTGTGAYMESIGPEQIANHLSQLWKQNT